MVGFDILDELINLLLKQHPQLLLIIELRGSDSISDKTAVFGQKDGDIFEEDAVIGLSMSTDIS